MDWEQGQESHYIQPNNLSSALCSYNNWILNKLSGCSWLWFLKDFVHNISKCFSSFVFLSIFSSCNIFLNSWIHFLFKLLYKKPIVDRNKVLLAGSVIKIWLKKNILNILWGSCHFDIVEFWMFVLIFFSADIKIRSENYLFWVKAPL